MILIQLHIVYSKPCREQISRLEFDKTSGRIRLKVLLKSWLLRYSFVPNLLFIQSGLFETPNYFRSPTVY
jgi:hypothetical protein